MATTVDLGDTSQSVPKSNASQVALRLTQIKSPELQDPEDITTYSITELEILLKGRLQEIQEDREYFTKVRCLYLKRPTSFSHVTVSPWTSP